jgi:prepilin-type N-terminal cleavage/methylation domain-containing protein
MKFTLNTYFSPLEDQRGFTLVEIVAVLVIVSVLSATAIAKHIDIEQSASMRVLETAVEQLNEHVRLAWYNSLLATGISGYSFYNGFLGEDVIVTKQIPGMEPKNGCIYLKRDGVQYELNWLPGADKEYGHFKLGIRRNGTIENAC